MKRKLVRYYSPALAIILILMLAAVTACTSEEPEETRNATPTNHPDPSSVSRSASTPVPVSEEAVKAFASEQASINEDWDKFHADFDRWRGGLKACDRTAALAALRQFASDFAEVTEQARDLPGTGIARELPDNVILAANSEEASLRVLRDKWQPGNPALLENAQTERGAAADLLRSTEIEVDKLEELDKPEDQEIAEDFAEAFEPVDEAWDEFYDSYEALEDDQIDLTAAEIVTRLRALVNEQEAVLEGLENLPSDKVTDPVQDPLIEAAEAEEEALGDLLDALRRAAKAESNGMDGDEGEEESEESSSNGEEETNGDTPSGEAGQSNGASNGGGNGAPQGSAGENGNNGVGSGELPGYLDPSVQGGVSTPPDLGGIPTTIGATPPSNGQEGESNGAGEEEDADGPPDYTPHFETFEETLDASKPIRKQAERDLETIIEGVSEEDKEALAKFTRAYDSLIQNWDSFHAEFDAWVRTEGECSRSDAVSELNDFIQRFGELSSRVRNLSQASYLVPSSDLLSEAIEREGAALRSLGGTWAPYEIDVYRGLDDERASAAKLRRLADRRTQELMERQGIQQ